MSTRSTENNLSRVVVHNHKGGTGKTMLAVHIAEYLVEQGQEWDLMDADPQHNAVSWLTGHAWSGEAALQLPGEGRRSKMTVTVDPETALSSTHLVVDTPPSEDSLEDLQRSGIELVSDDLLICPVSGRFGIDGAIKVAEEVRVSGCRVVVVLNMTDPDDDYASEEVQAARDLEEVENLGIEVFKMTIPRNDKYLRLAELQGMPVWDIPYARSTHTVGALQALCRWIAEGAPPEANRMGQLTPGLANHQGRGEDLQERLWEQ